MIKTAFFRKPIKSTFLVEQGLLEEDAFDPKKSNVKVLYEKDNPDKAYYLVERKLKKIVKED